MRELTPKNCLGRPRRSRGFTLIESVFALAVTAVALVWLVSASRYAAEATAVASNRTRAATLAAGLAARMQSRSGWPGNSEGVFEGAPGIHWRLDVTGVSSGTGPARCREVRLSVSYPGMGRAEEHLEFCFLVAGD